MPFINVAPQGGWSLGSIIAIIVLVLCVVLFVIGGRGVSPLELGLIAALAVARLT